jgi:tetratricopeptide (TPR) repeat protein
LPSVFISYRRSDVPGDARGVYDRLVQKFGRNNVFMDVDRLLAGQRFDRELSKALVQCEVLIAIIGQRWMELLSEHAHGGERDFVRDEIAAALKREIVVIPVLIGRDGNMPPLPFPGDLPEEIRDLVHYQKHTIAHESFDRDTVDLISAIGSVLNGPPAKPWLKVALPAAIILVGTIALSAYWFDLVPWRARSSGLIQSSSNGVAEKTELKRNTDADVSKNSGVGNAAKDDETAKISKLQLEASSGSVTAMYELGNYYFGKNTKLDDTETRKWFEKAAALNSSDAMIGLGVMYQSGRGVALDYTEARKWFEKAIASGDVRAFTSLGLMYSLGLGVPKDYTQARKFYEKAAAVGEIGAMFNLALYYEAGKGGLPVDMEQARKWFQQAADRGDEDAKTQLKNLK